MDGKTRTEINFNERIFKFHAQQPDGQKYVPVIDKIPVDLFKLKSIVALFGGFEKITEKKLWSAVTTFITTQTKDLEDDLLA
jgi:hypothetical protein